MTTEKILEVVAKYRKEYESRNIPKMKMNPKKTLGSLSSIERLSHAHFLLDGIVEYAQDPEKKG
ncbi:MAG: hypothetical protein Q8M83_01890 [bacterium]|nr:hypothetical protein [bacterium]